MKSIEALELLECYSSTKIKENGQDGVSRTNDTGVTFYKSTLEKFLKLCHYLE